MMRLFLLSLLLPAFLCARARTSGYCEQGGATVHTGAAFSQTKVQQSFPGCTVKVYVTGGAAGSVSTSGVAVTWISGVQFNSNWAGGTIVISSVQYLIQSVASSTSLTIVSSAGTQTAVAYSMPLAPAQIYSNDSGTNLSNPFTADQTGYWYFYADDGVYDVAFSGSTIVTPFTLGSISSVSPSYLANVKDFGAKGDGVTDDTAALQNCFTWAASIHGTCNIVPGTYKITGSGLSITAGQPTIYGNAPVGSGQPKIIYYGTGCALTIGTGASPLFAVTLENIAIIPAAGTTAACGIKIQSLSEAHWYGITIGGGATNGKFTTDLDLIDTNILAIDGFVVSNQFGVTGSTGVLFEEGGTYFGGNADIVISHADMFMLDTMFDVRLCIQCRIEHALNLEGFDYLVKIDNAASTVRDNNVFAVQDSNVLADMAAFYTHQKLAYLNAAAGKNYYLYLLDFSGNTMILNPAGGGVTSPFVVQIADAANVPYLHLRISGNQILGANTNVVNVSSKFEWAHLIFGYNNVLASGETIRTPDVNAYAAGTSEYLIDDALPFNATGQQLTWGDVNGTRYMAGASSNGMTRPAAGEIIPGAIYGVDVASEGNSDGFLRVGTRGGGNTVNTSFCDFSGFSTVTDMNRTIVCYVGGNEYLRMDPTQIKFTGQVTATGGYKFGDGSTQTTSAHSATGFTGAVVTGGCTMNFMNGVLQSKSGC